jgi:hypothetical protein
MVNRPDIIIKNKKKRNMYTNRSNNTSGQKCHAKGGRKETKIQKFMYRDTTNVRHEMCDCACNNWNRRNNNKGLKKKLEAIAGKHSIDSLQKTAVLRTSHITREVLQSEN